MAVDAISASNFGTLVKITNVTYSESDKCFKDADSNGIAYFDNFSASPTLEDGAGYDITGVILFKTSTTMEICPRSVADVAPKVVKTHPESVWYTDNTPTTPLSATVTINKSEVAGDLPYTFITDSDGDKSYESSNTSVASISNTGVITVQGYGIATITASTAASDTKYASEANFTLIVKDDNVDILTATLIGQSSYGDWTGKISYSGAVYAGNSTTNSGAIQIRNNSNTPSGIVVTSAVGKVEKISVKWASGNTEGRVLNVYGKNTPYTGAADLYGDAKGTELGSIVYSTSTTFVFDAEQNYAYVGMVPSGAVYIDYIVVEWDEDVVPMTVTDAGWASFSSAAALDFTGTGVTAYIAKAKDDTNVTLTEITKVPANTGIVVSADAGSYAIPLLSGDADETTGNLLKPWLTAGTPTEATYYTLAAGPSFKLSTGGVLAAGKAYLVLSGSSAPQLSVEFGGGTTGIDEVRSRMEGVREGVFDLQGRRVENPTKGIYIVNGKKVIIK